MEEFLLSLAAPSSPILLNKSKMAMNLFNHELILKIQTSSEKASTGRYHKLRKQMDVNSYLILRLMINVAKWSKIWCILKQDFIEDFMT